MNSLPNHHFQNKSFYQLSFDGGHLTQYGGLIFFQELFSQLKLKERISKYLVTNDQRRYCRYSDSDILVQFLFQLLTGYGTDYACKELSADAYFPKLLEGGQLASQPTLSRFLVFIVRNSQPSIVYCTINIQNIRSTKTHRIS
ncbi:IS1380-Spn1 transposase [Streptococcus pneumoniae]|nr:IS1380-Spn1 transposase [Streptococcus pneumoniae]